MAIMTHSRLIPASERIIEPMVALARCSKRQRILVTGTRSAELRFELHRGGYVRVATTANCGLPNAQYDVALVDGRQHSIKLSKRRSIGSWTFSLRPACWSSGSIRRSLRATEGFARRWKATAWSSRRALSASTVRQSRRDGARRAQPPKSREMHVRRAPAA
jgi:hypothetical protein